MQKICLHVEYISTKKSYFSRNQSRKGVMKKQFLDLILLLRNWSFQFWCQNSRLQFGYFWRENSKLRHFLSLFFNTVMFHVMLSKFQTSFCRYFSKMSHLQCKGYENVHDFKKQSSLRRQPSFSHLSHDFSSALLVGKKAARCLLLASS